jgi:2-keto-3-deoxy-L-rhamnonate aldolase RhmA
VSTRVGRGVKRPEAARRCGLLGCLRRGTLFVCRRPMFPSRVRQKLTAREPVICAKSSYLHPEIVEMLCTFGFDGIWLCLEHKRIDPSEVASLIQACRLRGVDAIMRVKPANYTDVLWLLETGARGIMLPRVRDVAEVREVVAMMKFPPVGRRGYDGVQPEAGFGRMAPADYIAEANRDTFLVVQIEEVDVVPQIDAIAATPGVDVLFVGPSDLTLGMGRFGRTEDPEVQAILREVVAACERHGKTAGIPCAVEQVDAYRRMGFRFLNVISDYRCLSVGLRKVQADLAAQGLDLRAPFAP